MQATRLLRRKPFCLHYSTRGAQNPRPTRRLEKEFWRNPCGKSTRPAGKKQVPPFENKILQNGFSPAFSRGIIEKMVQSPPPKCIPPQGEARIPCGAHALLQDWVQSTKNIVFWDGAHRIHNDESAPHKCHLGLDFSTHL